MKVKVTKETAVEAFKEVFKMHDITKSLCSDMSFLIHKEEFERSAVVSALQEWFSKHEIEDHYVDVSSMTLLYTSFSIKHLQTL